MKELIRIIIGSVAYLFILLTVLVFTERIPYTMINRVIEKDDEYSIINIIHLPKLFFWVFCIISGFAFVNIIALGNEFKDCLKSRHDRYFDIIVTLVYSLLAFNFTGNLVLYGQLDNTIKKCFNDLYKLNIERCIIQDTRSNQMEARVVLKNFLFFCIPFTIILHYFHIRKIEMLSNMILKPKKIKQWKSSQWTVFGSVIILIFLLIFKQFNDYPNLFNKDTVNVYAIYIISVIIAITAISKLLNSTHFLHLHHYFIGMLFMPLISYQDELNLVLLAFLLGMTIEGSAKWGLDPIWKRRKELPLDQISK